MASRASPIYRASIVKWRRCRIAGRAAIVINAESRSRAEKDHRDSERAFEEEEKKEKKKGIRKRPKGFMYIPGIYLAGTIADRARARARARNLAIIDSSGSRLAQRVYFYPRITEICDSSERLHASTIIPESRRILIAPAAARSPRGWSPRVSRFDVPPRARRKLSISISIRATDSLRFAPSLGGPASPATMKRGERSTADS